MTLTKSLLLGSAAALVAVASAQAADLPSKKAAPAQYVKICDAAGAGYFFIPGSDTCLKLSGYVEVDTHGQNTKPSEISYTNPYAQHAFDISIDAEITADTVTPTSYGDLTSHLALETEAGAPGSYNVGGGNTNTYLDKAYLTFAGLTAGKVETLFNHIEAGYNRMEFNPDYSVDALQYTASFGGGISATISIEDPSGNKTGFGNRASVDEGYSHGNTAPDVVGQLAVKQGWGEAGVDAAYHNADVVHSYDPVVSKSVDGYGLGAYAKINLPSLAAGDYIGLQANYDKNAIAFSGLTRSSQRFGGFTADNYSNNFDTVEQYGTFHDQTGWNVIANFQHNWSPTVSTTIGGSYGENRYADNGADQVWGMNYNAYAIGQVTKWTPVKGLEFGIDTTYIRYEDKPSAYQNGETGSLKSSDFQVDFRVIRSF